MGFVKVNMKHRIKGMIPYIINTDMIVCIRRSKDGYLMFLSSGNDGASSYEIDENNAKVIFDEIGVSLD